MEAHKAWENEEETVDRGDAYVEEVYTLRGIKGSSTGKRIDKITDYINWNITFSHLGLLWILRYDLCKSM